MCYLPKGLPVPVTESDKLDQPCWQGHASRQADGAALRRLSDVAMGPEWLCHKHHSWDMKWVEAAGMGKGYSWTRCWHPVHPALKAFGPYIAVVLEFQHTGNIRMLGNPQQTVKIGMPVAAAFEAHDDTSTPYTLVQWKRR